MRKGSFIPNHKDTYVQTMIRINQYNKMTITSIYYFPAQCMRRPCPSVALNDERKLEKRTDG